MSLLVEIQKDLGPFRLEVGFEARDGVTGVLGASGCGKSLTLKCIAGVESPDAGHIELDGRVLFDRKKRVNLPPQRRHVGYLFQNYALFPNMTVEQNIAAGVRDRAARPAAVAQMTAAFHLEECLGKYPRQLSGGQQQRVAIGRALMNSPAVMLADEPTGSLDSQNSQEILRLLKESHRKYHQTLLLVTHDASIALQADRILTIADGRVVRDERRVVRP